MKSVFDSTFRYRPSFDTDVRKTFDRIRRQQQANEIEKQNKVKPIQQKGRS